MISTIQLIADTSILFCLNLRTFDAKTVLKFWFVNMNEKSKNLELCEKRSVYNAYKRALRIWKGGSLLVWCELTRAIQQKIQKTKMKKILSVWIILYNEEKNKKCRNNSLLSIENMLRSKILFRNKRFIWSLWYREVETTLQEKKVQNVIKKHVSSRSLHLWIKKVLLYFIILFNFLLFLHY